MTTLEHLSTGRRMGLSQMKIETYEKLRLACEFDESEHPSEECKKILEVAVAEQGKIDAYSIYTPTCKKTSVRKCWLIRGRTVCLLCYQNMTFC